MVTGTHTPVVTAPVFTAGLPVLVWDLLMGPGAH